MATAGKEAALALRQRRDEVIEVLSEHFSQDNLDVTEFERRVDLAHRAEGPGELQGLVEDLEVKEPEDESLALVGPKRADPDALVDRPASRSMVAVLSGSERRGQWRVPEHLKIYTFLGGAVLDFREVALPPGVTEVTIYAILGGVEILVPPNLPIECDGIGVIGGFDAVDRVPAKRDPEAPMLKINGVAFMGGFEVQTRLPGESAREAKERRRRKPKRLKA